MLNEIEENCNKKEVTIVVVPDTQYVKEIKFHRPMEKFGIIQLVNIT